MNNRFFKILITGLIAGLIGACTEFSDKEQLYTQQFFSMGTYIHVTLQAKDQLEANRGFSSVAQDFEYLNEAWHPWKPGSLGRVNSLLPTGEKFSTGPSVHEILAISRPLAKQSKNLFNPAIGKLVRLWGFHSDTPQSKNGPDAESINQIIQSRPDLDQVKVQGVTLQTDNSEILLDFSGVAKGQAVAITVDNLKKLGFKAGIVNAGGDLQVFGKPENRDWRIGIKNPLDPVNTLKVRVYDGEAVFTSGNYERFYNKENKRVHHIIDPRTGHPTEGFIGVTVITTNPAQADAAATALMVAGPDEWQEIAHNMKVEYFLAMDIRGNTVASTKMLERLIDFEHSAISAVEL